MQIYLFAISGAAVGLGINLHTWGFVIMEWEALKSKYKGLGDEDMDVPEWHKDLVRKRLDEYNKDTGSATDFDSAMEDIEKEL